MDPLGSSTSVLALTNSALQLITSLGDFYKQLYPSKELVYLAQDIRLFQSVLKESTALIQSLSRPPPPSAELALDSCREAGEKIQRTFERVHNFARGPKWRRELLGYAHINTTSELEKALGRFKEAVLLLRDIASDSLTQELSQGVQINASESGKVFFNSSGPKISGVLNVANEGQVEVEAAPKDHSALHIDQEKIRWPQHRIQRDPYIFNGSINLNSAGEQQNWFPVRGMYDSGSIEVNLVRRDVLERANFSGGITKVNAVTIDGIGGLVTISESVNLRWAPDNDTQSYVAQCLVVDQIKTDLLICKQLMQEHDLANKNKSMVPTTLPILNRFRTRAERAQEEQETARLDREALQEMQEHQNLSRQSRRAATAQATEPVASDRSEPHSPTPPSN